jgi:hypothetical protein
MRRQLARAFGLLLGYAAMCLGLRLVDVLEHVVEDLAAGDDEQPAEAAA